MKYQSIILAILLSFTTIAPEASAKGRLEGRTAIITGASKGIGLGIAKVFAQEGAKVILVSRTEEDLKKSVASIAKKRGKSLIYRCRCQYS